MFAYRTSIHEATGFTPYHLNFGRSPCLPIDVLLGRSPVVNRNSRNSYPDFVRSVHQQLQQSMKLARDSIRKQHQRHKQLYDHHATATGHIAIGDQVWLYNPAVKRGQTKKLSSMWKGPYTVIDKCGPVNFRIQLIGGTQRLLVHYNRLKPCYGTPSPLTPSHIPSVN